MTPPPRPDSTRQARAGIDLALSWQAPASPVVVIWRWRYELLATVSQACIWIALKPAAAAVLTAGVACAVATVAAIPQGRRLLVARAWCVVTPHRIRSGCAQAWIHSRTGKIPAVLLCRHQPFGERVYLWCRAGTSACDLHSARELLAAACWAQDIFVMRHPRYAHLVALDVVRTNDDILAGMASRIWRGSGTAH